MQLFPVHTLRSSRTAGMITCIRLHYLFIYILFISCCINPVETYADSSAHSMTTTQWRELKSDKAFDYKNDKELVVTYKERKPGPFEKFFLAFFSFFGTVVGNLILWAMIICVVAFVVFKLFFSNGSFFFSRDKKSMNKGDTEIAPEDIGTTNWETLLHHARDAGDMRLAVRYTYMWLLQLLQQKELIQFRSDKTNYDYYYELRNPDIRQSFRDLSRHYEYAWYGKFTIPHSTFTDFYTRFSHLKNQLGS